MSFDWTQFLVLARQLVGDGTAHPGEEAKRRTSISRAYYAAFSAARRMAAASHRIPRTGEAHRAVPQWFKTAASKTKQRVAVNLERLRDDRRRADYEDVVSGLPSLTTASIQRSQQILADLTKLGGSSGVA